MWSSLPPKHLWGLSAPLNITTLPPWGRPGLYNWQRWLRHDRCHSCHHHQGKWNRSQLFCFIQCITGTIISKTERMLKSLQTCNHPLQLLLDMKVWWSSMFIMLHHALDLKEVSNPVHPMLTCANQPQEVNTFGVQLGSQEWDSEKWRKLYKLQLNDAEWEHVHHVPMLLVVCTIIAVVGYGDAHCHS